MESDKTTDEAEISDEKFQEMRDLLYQSIGAHMTKIAKGTLNVAENLKVLGATMEKTNEYILEMAEKVDNHIGH